MFPYQYPQLPMLKAPPWFGGQIGVPGSDSPLGFRTHPDAVVLYVDSGHSEASDNNDGTDPLAPKATVQSAIDSTLLVPYSTVLVSGTVAEDVEGPDYVTGPGYISIIGQGVSRYSPAWEGDAADVASLDLRAVGWYIGNFRFYGQTSAPCIELRHTDTGANDIAIRTVIENCYFDGLTTGETGIESHGCYDVWIRNCTFALWNNVGNDAAGMRVTTTPLAIPYRNHIVDCLFYDSDNHCIWPSNGSYFYRNMFQSVGYAYSAVQNLNTSLVANPGDDNVVFGNYFGGDYSIAGGYRPGAADEWIGNFSPDTAEAEVGTDNGLTIARPT